MAAGLARRGLQPRCTKCGTAVSRPLLQNRLPPVPSAPWARPDRTRLEMDRAEASERKRQLVRCWSKPISQAVDAMRGTGVRHGLPPSAQVLPDTGLDTGAETFSPCHGHRARDSASEHRKRESRKEVPLPSHGGETRKDLSKGNTTQVSDRKCTYGRDLRPQPPKVDEVLTPPQWPAAAHRPAAGLHLQIYCQPARTAPGSPQARIRV